MSGRYVRKKHRQQHHTATRVVLPDNPSIDSDLSPDDKTTTVAEAKRNKRLVVTLVAVLLVGALAMVVSRVSFSVDKKADTVAAPSVADSTIKQFISEAVPLLQENKGTELGAVVDKIKATANYTTSPDLLYIVTQYYVLIGDNVGARSSFDQLAAVYSKEKGFSDLFGSNLKSFEDIKLQVEFLEDQAKKIFDFKFEGTQ